MLYGSMAGHEAAFLRRKLEEQQQQEAAELQHAIELQGRRLMGLQFLDLKSRGHHLGSPVGSPSDGNGGCFSGNGNGVHLDDAISTIQGPVLEKHLHVDFFFFANAHLVARVFRAHHDFHACLLQITTG